MKGKNYTKDFKETVLREVRETNNVGQVARRHEVSTKTIYAWRKQANTSAWEATDGTAKKLVSYTPTDQEFRQVERENNQLKHLLGEKDLEIALLREVLKKSQPGYRTRLK